MHVLPRVHMHAGHQINLGKICGHVGSMSELAVLFEKYDVDAYFGGHTHALGYHPSNGVSYFLTGGGGQAAGLCGGGTKTFGANSMGVLRGSLNATQFLAEFYDNTGKKLFSNVQHARKLTRMSSS